MNYDFHPIFDPVEDDRKASRKRHLVLSNILFWDQVPSFLEDLLDSEEDYKILSVSPVIGSPEKREIWYARVDP